MITKIRAGLDPSAALPPLSYRSGVLAIVLLWGILDTLTAMWAVDLNWLGETGLVLSYVLENRVIPRIGARGYGPIAVLAIKSVFTVVVYVALTRYAEEIQSVPGWRAYMIGLILWSAYGPLSNVLYILEVGGYT